MGWFLIRKSKKKQPVKTARPGAAGKPRWDPARTLAGLKFLLSAVLVVAVVVGWRYAEGYLSGYVSQTRTRAAQTQAIVLANAPQWMPVKLSSDLIGLVAAQVDADPLDGQSLELARSALAYSPWVQHVQRVQRMPDGSVRVWAEYRTPFALVRKGSSLHMVDLQGVRLPDREDLNVSRLPVIEGVVADPLAEGQVWPGRDLQAGLELARVLVRQPYAQQIRGIDVRRRDQQWRPDPDGRTRIVLWTDRGRDVAVDPHVRWGLPPGHGRAIEPDLSAKLASLLSLYNYQHRRSIHLPDRWADVSISSEAVFVKPSSTPEGSRTTMYTWTQ